MIMGKPGILVFFPPGNVTSKRPPDCWRCGSSKRSCGLVIGANGMGKTTTIGKLANRLREEAGQKVMLAACDTFRVSSFVSPQFLIN